MPVVPLMLVMPASRIANFIDRWHVLRVVDDLPV
jgi:hypothetical protein